MSHPLVGVFQLDHRKAAHHVSLGCWLSSVQKGQCRVRLRNVVQRVNFLDVGTRGQRYNNSPVSEGELEAIRWIQSAARNSVSRVVIPERPQLSDTVITVTKAHNDNCVALK
jgi:hypothetical protein